MVGARKSHRSSRYHPPLREKKKVDQGSWWIVFGGRDGKGRRLDQSWFEGRQQQHSNSIEQGWLTSGLGAARVAQQMHRYRRHSIDARTVPRSLAIRTKRERCHFDQKTKWISLVVAIFHDPAGKRSIRTASKGWESIRDPRHLQLSHLCQLFTSNTRDKFRHPLPRNQ